MAGYPRDLAEHGPCRSLAEYRLQLRGDRFALLLAQHEAETRGSGAAVARLLSQLEAADARLRAVEAELEERAR